MGCGLWRIRIERQTAIYEYYRSRGVFPTGTKCGFEAESGLSGKSGGAWDACDAARTVSDPRSFKGYAGGIYIQTRRTEV